LFLGYSAGSAFQAVRQVKDELNEDSVVVVLFHDHGSRYVGKVYNDDWMRDRGFLNKDNKIANDLIEDHRDMSLVTVGSEELVGHAIEKMREFKISQLPVMRDGSFVGSLDETQIFQLLSEDRDVSKRKVADVMQKPFPIVQSGASISEVSKLISKEVPAVLVELDEGQHHIITRHDVIRGIG